MQRFAMSYHGSNPSRAAWHTQRARHALDRYVAERGYRPHEDQPPIDASHDDLQLLHAAGAMTRHAMQQAGYDWQPNDPQLVVSVDFARGRAAFRVPVASHPATGAPTAGYDAHIHANAVAVWIYDATRLDRPVWRGSAVHVGRASDFHAIAPTLLDHVLAEFPYPTRAGGRRLVAVPR
jgi:hypothetical protein